MVRGRGGAGIRSLAQRRVGAQRAWNCARQRAAQLRNEHGSAPPRLDGRRERGDACLLQKELAQRGGVCGVAARLLPALQHLRARHAGGGWMGGGDLAARRPPLPSQCDE